MTVNKVLIKLYVPVIEEEYDVWIPLNKRVYNVTNLLVKVLQEFSFGEYNPTRMPKLYNRITGVKYESDQIIEDTSIRNGTEIILI